MGLIIEMRQCLLQTAQTFLAVLELRRLGVPSVQAPQQGLLKGPKHMAFSGEAASYEGFMGGSRG